VSRSELPLIKGSDPYGDVGAKACALETEPVAKEEYASMLAKLRRKYLVLPTQYGEKKLLWEYEIDSPQFQKHPAFKVQQLVKQGRAHFDEFSEGARVYAAFSRIAQINEVTYSSSSPTIFKRSRLNPFLGPGVTTFPNRPYLRLTVQHHDFTCVLLPEDAHFEIYSHKVPFSTRFSSSTFHE
jgi:hypothetical protein